MNRSIRILGLVFSSLTIATVAIAQQSGGQGRSEHAALPMLQDDASHKPRLTRAVERRASMMCRAVRVYERPCIV
jgi:hypothetical protein